MSFRTEVVFRLKRAGSADVDTIFCPAFVESEDLSLSATSDTFFYCIRSKLILFITVFFLADQTTGHATSEERLTITKQTLLTSRSTCDASLTLIDEAFHLGTH